MSLTDEEHEKAISRLIEIGLKSCKICGRAGLEPLGVTESSIQAEKERPRCVLVFCRTCGHASVFLLSLLLGDVDSEKG